MARRCGAMAAGWCAIVLVASGDFSMGLRELAGGGVAYADAPKVDHTYANTGLPAVEVGNDPLSALDELAQQVKAAGITAVSGDVVIDDRLFTTFFGWPDIAVSPASPIMINDNRIDIESTPTTPDQLATVDYGPKTSAFTVDTQVKTVPAGQAWDIQVSQPAPDKFLVTGTIAADAGKVLRVGEIPDPASFARSAFIDALQRAGVTVTAPATGPNPSGTLPAENSYPAGNEVAKHVSGTLADIVKVILKTSHNPGADLMACLDAVASGSKDCEAGLVAEQQYVSGTLGVDPSSFMIFDGAGSDDRDRSAPTAMDTFHRSIDEQPYADAYQDALPVLGERGGGDLADLGVGTGAAGHVFAKTGTRAGITPAGIGLLGARTMTGYIDARSGRHLVFTIMIRDVPFRTLDDILTVIHDAADLSISIWQSY
jgi:serine-type D-Ala-D-Ala carboxypeptidase/endopeptidase (penicillin-binding protein 4)